MKPKVQNIVHFFEKPTITGIIKVVLVLCLVTLLIRQVSGLKLNADFLSLLAGKLNLAFLLLGIVLVIPNYYLEISKWKKLSATLEDRSFKNAQKEVLRGLKWGIFTPFMLGDYWGRSKDFKKENIGSAVVLNLYNSVTQTWTSLLFGSLALGLAWFDTKNPYIGFIAIVLLLATILGVGVLYGTNFSGLRKIKFIAKYIREFNIPNNVRHQIILLSILRTVIYNLQYLCFYLSFGIIVSAGIYFTGINLLLLIKTVGGGLNVFGDLTIRELVSMQYFGSYGIDQRLVLIATFVVWLVNVFSPVLYGIFTQNKE